MGFALMRHHRSWLGPATSICLLVGACGSTSTTGAPLLPTLVVVRPERFLGQVPCLDTEGAAKLYVATLADFTPNLFGRPEATATSFTLASSPPTSCHLPVGFGFVTAGHQYVADIQVYDRSDLVPAATGGAVMLDPEGNYLAPRWTTTCGQKPEVTGQGPTICASNVLATVKGCIPLANAAAPAETIVALRPKGALGSLSCGDSAGQIASFVVVPEAAGLAEQTATSCDAELSYAGLEPGQGYTFDLYAYEPGATAPRWGATCLAHPSQGVTVVADCDPLTDQGSLVVDLGAWLASAQQACGAGGVTEVTVSVFTPNGVVVRTSRMPDCALPLTFDTLLPGAYPIRVSASTSAGAGLAGDCDAVVMPGKTTVATCDPVGA
jgi:hypothetical protein